jgi:hypothetical protein
MNPHPLKPNSDTDFEPVSPACQDVSANPEPPLPHTLWFTPEQAARVWRAIEEWPEACKTKGDGPFTAG